MNNDVWSQDEERNDLYMEVPEDGTYAIVNGSVVRLTPGSSFKDTIQSLARDAGFGKFRVLVAGEEVRPNEAPETIQDGMSVELRPYDVAG